MYIYIVVGIYVYMYIVMDMYNSISEGDPKNSCRLVAYLQSCSAWYFVVTLTSAFLSESCVSVMLQ